MGIKHMTGSPWHVEKMTRQEGDNRRHKTHCAHYLWETKGCDLCGRCFGSAHCSKYRKMSPEDEERVKKQKEAARKNKGNGGTFWF